MSKVTGSIAQAAPTNACTGAVFTDAPPSRRTHRVDAAASCGAQRHRKYRAHRGDGDCGCAFPRARGRSRSRDHEDRAGGRAGNAGVLVASER
jgi:hypothetical protein